MEQKNFLKGALLGGVLGGVTALLVAPKSGRELREDIADGYTSFSERSHDFADDIKKQSYCLLERGQKMFNGVEENHNTFLTGGAIGAVIGAVAALLLAPQAGFKLREHLGDSYDEIREKAEEVVRGFNDKKHNLQDKIEDWRDTFSTIVEKLSQSSRKGSKGGYSKIDELVEWANLGLRLYHQLHNRR